jgi:hypothetical protein
MKALFDTKFVSAKWVAKNVMMLKCSSVFNETVMVRAPNQQLPFLRAMHFNTVRTRGLASHWQFHIICQHTNRHARTTLMMHAKCG